MHGKSKGCIFALSLKQSGMKTDNLILELESKIANYENSLEWMSRPDQDDDYVVCGLGWKAVQDGRIACKRAIESLKEHGRYTKEWLGDDDREYPAMAFPISLREVDGDKADEIGLEIFCGPYGFYIRKDGKCISTKAKKLASIGYEVRNARLVVFADGSEKIMY